MTEEHILIRILGDYPLIRVLNFLVMFREFDYSLSDIAEESDVAWSTLHQFWPRLEQLGLVILTREVGNAKMYKLNTQNPLTQDLIRFTDSLVWNYTHKNILHEKVVMV